MINISDISLLKASEKKRNEMLNFLSHDLRSPLASTIAMLELAKNKDNIKDIQATMSEIENNTHKTLDLAEQFLQLSRANSHETIHFYDTNFNDVVLNAIDQIWGLSNNKQITIVHKFDRDEIRLQAKPTLLERAIVNLLSNAIKYSPNGARIDVNVQLTNEEIQCCVIDHGKGISREELPYLFDVFRRTQEATIQRQHGVGLGLAFVDAVAKRHSNDCPDCAPVKRRCPSLHSDTCQEPAQREPGATSVKLKKERQ